MRPLENTTVISLEQAVAAPFAARQLGDLGARVIKIERPGVGDFARRYDGTVNGLSSHFVWCNRSKESLTLNLKAEAGKEILEKLLAQADVFIQNLAPGATERLGFDSERLLADYPELIVCNISGYGSSGPYRDKKAYDALIQAETGLFSITGTEDTPSKAGISVADIAGGMYAYSGILAALLARSQNGEGAVLEVSLFEALAEWMGYAYYFTMGGKAPERNGSSHAAIAPYGLFPTGDGQTVMLGIQNEREWARFCEDVLSKPEMIRDERFASNSSRVANRQAMRQEIEAIFTQLTAEEIMAKLEAAQIANAQARSMESFLDHPQLKALQKWTEVDSPNGPIPALLPAVSHVGMVPNMGAIPTVGEHTKAILQELDYSNEEIREFELRGVV
ncbi:MAG: CaiB/BaiF CoA-transferase family protein [Chloroflexota bacterium]